MKPDPALLDKYLQGSCTEAERVRVEAWYAGLPKDQNLLDPISNTEKEELLKEAFRQISNRLDREEEVIPVRSFPWGWITGIAASLLLVCGLLYTRYNPFPTPSEQSATVSGAAIIAPMEFVNREPRIVQHTLPDGSTVWLRPEARIRYPQEFAQKNRTVTFSGEGFFDIQKDRSRPFFIHSGEMTVRVLGTSFNVKAASDQKIFEIDVVTGSVEVSAPDHKAKAQQLVLKPNQQALFETDTKRLFTKAQPELAQNEIYQPSTFHFQDALISDVIRQLESQFAVHVKLSNPALARCRLNADFENQPLPAILEMLCRSLESTYTIQDTTITIAGEPCN